VIEFAKTETPSTLIVQELNSGKADFYYKKVREEITALNFSEAYENFIKESNLEMTLKPKYSKNILSQQQADLVLSDKNILTH